MGYRVENYSLDELHRIAVPGIVPPALFWALPIGGWRPGELDDVWRWFTERPSECRDYGLLLVKDMRRHEAEDSNVSLTTVGAELSDLMPTGAGRFVSPSALLREPRRVLVLSGGYPQPGWGVLVEWPNPDIQSFENLIRHVTSQLTCTEESATKLKLFPQAAGSFHRWRDLGDGPRGPDTSTLQSEILEGEQIHRLIEEAQAALKEGQFRVVGWRISAAQLEIKSAAWLGISEVSFGPLLETQRSLLAAASIAALSEEVLAKEIVPKIEALVADPNLKEATFRSLPTDGFKHALKACLRLRSNETVDEPAGYHFWAQQILAEKPAGFAGRPGCFLMFHVLAGIARNIFARTVLEFLRKHSQFLKQPETQSTSGIHVWYPELHTPTPIFDA